MIVKPQNFVTVIIVIIPQISSDPISRQGPSTFPSLAGNFSPFWGVTLWRSFWSHRSDISLMTTWCRIRPTNGNKHHVDEDSTKQGPITPKNRNQHKFHYYHFESSAVDVVKPSPCFLEHIIIISDTVVAARKQWLLMAGDYWFTFENRSVIGSKWWWLAESQIMASNDATLAPWNLRYIDIQNSQNWKDLPLKENIILGTWKTMVI